MELVTAPIGHTGELAYVVSAGINRFDDPGGSESGVGGLWTND